MYFRYFLRTTQKLSNVNTSHYGQDIAPDNLSNHKDEVMKKVKEIKEKTTIVNSKEVTIGHDDDESN